MSRRTRRGVGVDIGATAVRVVEVSGLDADSVAQITRCAIVPLQPGSVHLGQIQDPSAVGWALSEAVKEAKIPTYGAVLGIAGPDTAVARVQLAAALNPNEWGQALRAADRSISPKLPLATSALSLYPVPSPQDLTDPTSRTLLAAATTDAEVDTLLAVAKKSKITPRAVDLSAAAMVRALTRSVLGNEDVATLVDIGSSKVTVVTRQGLHVRSVRTFEGGGDRITRSVMGALGGGYDAAEEAKLSMRLPSATGLAPTELTVPEVQSLYGSLPTPVERLTPGGDATKDALVTAATSLVEDIAAAVEADAAAHPYSPTQGILLCGGSSMLRGLKEQIVQRVGVPAVVGRPWARVIPSKYTQAALNDGVEDPVVLLSLATAVGLAIWKDPR